MISIGIHPSCGIHRSLERYDRLARTMKQTSALILAAQHPKWRNKSEVSAANLQITSKLNFRLPLESQFSLRFFFLSLFSFQNTLEKQVGSDNWETYRFSILHTFSIRPRLLFWRPTFILFYFLLSTFRKVFQKKAFYTELFAKCLFYRNNAELQALLRYFEINKICLINFKALRIYCLSLLSRMVRFQIVATLLSY